MSTSQADRLKKLYALALHGVGGEKEQAAALLAKLSKKYGVSMDDLDEEKTQQFRFAFHGQKEEDLLSQIAYKVTNRTDIFYYVHDIYSGRKKRSVLAIECTEAQRVEIEFLFDFYKALWERECEALLQAFIQKHQLFGDGKNCEKSKKLSEEELEKLYSMMRGLSDATPLAQIEKPKERK